MKTESFNHPFANQKKIQERFRAAVREQETVDYPFNEAEKPAKFKKELSRYWARCISEAADGAEGREKKQTNS